MLFGMWLYRLLCYKYCAKHTLVVHCTVPCCAVERWILFLDSMDYVCPVLRVCYRISCMDSVTNELSVLAFGN